MFAIGDERWSGVAKLLEEMGELSQVLGKIMGIRGETVHWSGDLKQMLLEEMSDVFAAMVFLEEHNLTTEDQMIISKRVQFKLNRFEAWHRGEYCAGCGAQAIPADPCVCKAK